MNLTLTHITAEQQETIIELQEIHKVKIVSIYKNLAKRSDLIYTHFKKRNKNLYFIITTSGCGFYMDTRLAERMFLLKNT